MQNPMGRREFLLATLAAGMSATQLARGAVARAKPDKLVRFKQDRFCISFWVDPPADAHMEAHYARIAAANFNVVMGGFGAKTAATVKRQLDLCQKYALKAIVNLPGYSGPPARAAYVKNNAEHPPRSRWVEGQKMKQADQFPNHPACWGYRLWDEPGSGLFPYLRFVVAHLRKRRPGKLGFINLLPTYASAAGLGEGGPHPYEKYVADFVRQVNPDVLCMDYYPFMQPRSDTRDGYCHNLAILRKHALAQGIPFWNFFNDMAFGGHYDPTAAQIRWQIYTSLAYGAKGVLYFCYRMPGALVDADGRPTHHYPEARRINARLKNLGPTLMRLTSTAVYRVPRGANSAAILKHAPLKLSAGVTPGDYLIGTFKHADGRTAVLLNNYSYAYTAWPTVKFAASTARVKEVDPETGKEIPVRDDRAAMKGTQIWLAPGEGRLFLFPQ